VSSILRHRAWEFTGCLHLSFGSVQAAGLEVELTGRNLMLADDLLDEPLGPFGTLTGRHHPAGDVAAEDVEHHVEIKVGPFGRTWPLGDVPTPKLVWRRGQQLRLLVGRVHERIALTNVLHGGRLAR
jgi:hypothetical protein